MGENHILEVGNKNAWQHTYKNLRCYTATYQKLFLHYKDTKKD